MPIKYVGGHPARSKSTTCTVTVDDHGVRARIIREFLNIPWSDVKGLKVDGPEDVHKRVTMTRLVATGLFAFALKKPEKLAYLVVETEQGEAMFETDKMTAVELRAKFGWALR
jgi:hypothetical protein